MLECEKIDSSTAKSLSLDNWNMKFLIEDDKFDTIVFILFIAR